MILIRFDVAYHGRFKANPLRLDDYPALAAAYTRRLDEHPDIGPTVDCRHIRTGHYLIGALDPTRIVPRGPAYILGSIDART